MPKKSTLKCIYCGKKYILENCSVAPYYFDRVWKDIPQCDCLIKIEGKKQIKEDHKKEGIKLINLIRLIRGDSFGKRYQKASFSNFDKSRNKKAWEACLEWARNFEQHLEDGKGLFITGTVGTGKTHLLAAISDYIARIFKRKLKTRPWINYVTSTELISQIKNSFESHNTEEVIEGFEECSLLIIDDIGTEKITEFSYEQIYKIIDSRYRNMKPVIITSNLNDNEIKEKLSERIVSRIYETCKGIKLTGKDYRLEKLK